MIRIVLPLLALLALPLVLAQILLPRIAASTISSRVGRYGTVESVRVKAWPAVRLLWGSADSVTLRARDLALTPGQTAALLAETHRTDRLDVAVGDVREGSLHLTDARLLGHGGQLFGEALLAGRDVGAALPPGIAVRLLGSAGGKVTVRVSGGLFGLDASVQAIAEASDGALIVHPTGVLLGGLRLTLLSDPRIYVEGVAAEIVQANPLVYRLSMTARLR